MQPNTHDENPDQIQDEYFLQNDPHNRSVNSDKASRLSSFYQTVMGNSMEDHGIDWGDIIEENEILKTLSASLWVCAPPELDAIIETLAPRIPQSLESSKTSIAQPASHLGEWVKVKIQELWEDVLVAPGFQFQARFFTLAAAGDASEPLVLTGKDDAGGDWSLETSVDPLRPAIKTLRLYFKGKDARAYEGHTVRLQKGTQLILSGVVKRGRVKAEVAVDVAIVPPLDLSID